MSTGLTRKIRFQVAGARTVPIRSVTAAAAAQKPVQINEGEIMPVSRYDWGGTNLSIERRKGAGEPAPPEVISHPLYHPPNRKDAAMTFMEHHTFGGWDFMSFLKTLQRSLPCIKLP